MQQKIVLHASIISLGRILLMKCQLMDCEQKIDALQSELMVCIKLALKSLEPHQLNR